MAGRSGAAAGEAAAVTGLADNLRRQDEAARALKESRHRRGALTLDTIEGRPVFDGDTFATSPRSGARAPRN